jgi:hypothetical protein
MISKCEPEEKELEPPGLEDFLMTICEPQGKLASCIEE